MITDPKVENYLYAMLPERGAMLQEIEQQAKERDIPIVGPAVGRLFYQYARLIGAKTVFEMGSAVGYSTIWWAMAVGEGGKVHYTDGSRKNADEARGYFERAGVADRIQVHVGDALEVLSERKEQFDIALLDIDKHDYPRAARMAPERVRRGRIVRHRQHAMARRCRLRRRQSRLRSRRRSPTKRCAPSWSSTSCCTSRPTGSRRSFRCRDGVTVAMRL